MLTPAYTEALERSLGAIVGRAAGELSLIRERADAIVAASTARVAEADARLRVIEAQIAGKLGTLKDGRDGKDGKDADPDLITSLVADAVGRIPVPKDGRDGKDGEPGATGASGVDGANGIDGKEGPPGRDGKDGEPGLSGANGRDGVDGAPGRDGADGMDGKEGPAGRDGVDGQHGLPGKDGAPGKIVPVKAWSDGVHYDGEIVAHLDSTWQAQRDTGREPPHDDWVCIARGGRDGADGRSFTIRGTWSETENYLGLDVVALNGASFAARHDDPGPCPGEGWQLIAAQGKRGNPGDRGVGTKGERGTPGAAAVAIEVDDEGLLTLTNGDGTTVICDLYPLLAKLR